MVSEYVPLPQHSGAHTCAQVQKVEEGVIAHTCTQAQRLEEGVRCLPPLLSTYSFKTNQNDPPVSATFRAGVSDLQVYTASYVVAGIETPVLRTGIG